MRDDEAQERIWRALDNVLREVGCLQDGQVMTGYVVCIEVQREDGEPFASRMYGPAGMTTWRALGLVEYTTRSDGLYDNSTSIDSSEDDDD